MLERIVEPLKCWGERITTNLSDEFQKTTDPASYYAEKASAGWKSALDLAKEDYDYSSLQIALDMLPIPVLGGRLLFGVAFAGFAAYRVVNNQSYDSLQRFTEPTDLLFGGLGLICAVGLFGFSVNLAANRSVGNFIEQEEKKKDNIDY